MKKIKNIFVLNLLIVALSSCSSNDSINNESSKPSPYSENLLPDSITNAQKDSLYLNDGNIIGDWTNCATTYKGVTTMANVCRTISFRLDKTALITYPSQETEMIKWSISNNLLLISHYNKNISASQEFTDSAYECTLSIDENKILNLKLKAKSADLIYYLGKSYTPQLSFEK